MENTGNFEEALAKTESDVNAALKAAASAVSSLKKFRLAVVTGNVRELNKIIEASQQAIDVLTQRFITAKEGWNFDAEAYIAGRAFPEDLLKVASQMGVKMFEQDERLYCYPFIVSIVPSEMSVKIDKQKEKRLRPSFLVGHLRDLQNRPVRFKSEVFLEGLYAAYDHIVKSLGEKAADKGFVVPLIRVYRLLTIMPHLAREYSLQEFARDVYLLDQSGITHTKRGFAVSLPASTGTKSPGSALRVITREGSEKRYYGISFTAG